MSDDKHEEIHKLRSSLIEKNPTVFEPLLFSTNSGGVQSLSLCITMIMLKQTNRPFPSSYLPPLQSESKCVVFVMVISSTLHMNEN